MVISFGRIGQRSCELLVFGAFIQLVASNLHGLVLRYVASSRTTVLLISPMFFMLSLLRSIEQLKNYSIMGNVCMGLTLASVVIRAITRLVDHGLPEALEGKAPTEASPTDIYLFVGAMFFAFEGMSGIMPISNAFANSYQFP